LKSELIKETSLIRNTAKVSFWTFSSRILGLLRDIATTSLLGAGVAHDVFVVMLRIPNVFRSMVAEGAFNQAFIPVLIELKKKNNPHEIKLFINKVFSVLLSFVFIFTVISMILAPVIILIFAPGFYFDPEKKIMAINVLRLTFPYLFFISLVALFGGVLNSYQNFSIPAATPIIFNLTIIFVVIFIAESFESPVYAVAGAVFISGVLQFFFNLNSIKALGLIPKWNFDLKDKRIKKVYRLMIPGLISGGIIQLNILIDTVFASLLKTGSPTWLYVSDRLMQLPLGIFGIAIATVILPKLSENFSSENTEDFSKRFNWAIQITFLIALPSSIGLYYLSTPIIETFFMNGEFTLKDAFMTAQSLQAFTFGLTAFMVIKILNAGFFSRQDTKTPMFVSLFSFITNIILNWFLAFHLNLGHVGLALGSSLAAILSVLILFYILMDKSLLENTNSSFIFILKIVLASSVLIAFMEFISPLWFSWAQNSSLIQILYLLAIIIASVLIYFLMLFVTGIRLTFFRV
jgi:putative peptidoglycan lipid II flippase